jgi:Gluconate 2-dehydrogenase subunit 3
MVELLSGVVAVPVLSGYTAEGLFALGRRLHARTAADHRLLGLFDPHQRATVAAIAERIIPETDTPGAGRAGVPGFIELIVAEHYHDDERARFLAGLTDVDARSRAVSGRDFIETRPAEQNGILSALEDEAEAATAEKPPEKKAEEPSHKPTEKPREALPARPIEKPVPFWGQIKFLTIYGYYTSQIGMTRELHSVVIPGRYDPCVAAGIRAPGGT